MITYGTMLDNVLTAAQKLSDAGIEATVLRLLAVSPLPIQQILAQLSTDGPVLVVEETMHGSGICDSLAMAIHEYYSVRRILGMDLGSKYVAHGSVSQLYKHCLLDADSIVKHVLEVLQSEN